MLEVCVDSTEAALIAIDAGAQRIEFCSRLDVGGVTPLPADIERLRQSIQVPLIVLIRCRPGDFVFSETEYLTMLEQAQSAIDAGADGVAIGGLIADGTLHYPFLEVIRSKLHGSEVVVHRAFDWIDDKEAAIQNLVEIGIHRVLTSGGPNMALQGCQQLRRLVEIADGEIEVLPAGGIRSENASTILVSTGCTQLHGSFRSNDKTPETKDVMRTRQILDEWLVKRTSSSS